MEKNVYSKAKISLRALDIAITVGLLTLALVIIFLSANGGYELSFETNGGSEIESQHLRYGDKIEIPDDPTKSDYVFAGWYADEELSEEFDFESSAIDKDTIVFASWKKAE